MLTRISNLRGSLLVLVLVWRA